MSTIIQESPVDVVVLGAGQCGGPVSAELSLAGYTVVCIEKGPFWDYAVDWAPSKYDEWAVSCNHKWDHPLPISTFSIRNNGNQFANPVRRYTTGMPYIQFTPMGHGVGGAAVHYGGGMGRIDWALSATSETASKYGPNFISSIEPNQDMQDWPFTYDDAVPYYNSWEQAMGIVGTNQDPFIPNATFPLPPHPSTPLGDLFQSTAESMGYSPFPQVSALVSKPYSNQYGIPRNACIYDGWCGDACDFQCETGAKGSSHVTTIPAAIASGNFTLQLQSYVFRIDVDTTTNLATGVSYYDAAGNIHSQPAKVVYSAIWSWNTIRLMQLSGIGTPYNPTTVTGSVGRAPALDTPAPPVAGASGTINMGGNSYAAGNATGGGFTILDFAEDNFDHTGLNFIGGAAISIGGYLGSGPSLMTMINPNSPGTAFGSTFKASLKNVKLPTKLSVGVSPAGTKIPQNNWFIDLDPNYNDIYGDPIARITYDWSTNAWNAAAYIAPAVEPLLTKMGVSNITVSKATPNAVHPDGWGHHVRGGIRMGTDSSSSALNQWLQTWSYQNVFAACEAAEPMGDSITPGTHVAGMLSYVAADGIKQYLQNPGPLV